MTKQEEIKKVLLKHSGFAYDSDARIIDCGKLDTITAEIVNRLGTLVMPKIAEAIRGEAKDFNKRMTIHHKDLNTEIINNLVKDNVTLFAEYIANYLTDNDSNFSA